MPIDKKKLPRSVFGNFELTMKEAKNRSRITRVRLIRTDNISVNPSNPCCPWSIYHLIYANLWLVFLYEIQEIQ